MEVGESNVNVGIQSVWAVKGRGAFVALNSIFFWGANVMRIAVCWAAYYNDRIDR